MAITVVNFYDYRNIHCGKTQEVWEEIVKKVGDGEKLFIVTLNSQIFIRAQKDFTYARSIKKSNFIIPDGAGIVWALKKHCRIHTDRITGIDTMLHLCYESTRKNWSVFLLGTKYEIIKKAAANLKALNVNVVGYHHGYFKDNNEVREQIEKLKPDLVFVAMGIPRQEEWIVNNMDLPFKLAMAVGGSIDVIAGAKRRAPIWMQKLQLEWLYRWLSEPIKRSRVPIELTKFFFKVILDGRKNISICSKSNPSSN